ncbi:MULTISPECIES: hypothetical protein [unclassified Streptomyces]|uniref:hypothetical protein n=1 Tax=unclassified Streptomyces TaxID=2593676 RepID=UPI0004CC479C|nr:MULTISPECIES: hypothetical protein [unclassified Streptomyces]KOV86080.1 hypothetical protein ADL02_19505 [Streptomyces sp. NRRL WC-3723]
MKAPKNPLHDKPPILYGAIALAVLSLIWSGYAITDLMRSGRFGLSVALAGDIGWITVLWAEYRGVAILGRAWAATAAGWGIAGGVAYLLVVHGDQAGGRAQAIAGPFVVLVGKIVWAFALEAMKDPTALTPEQQAEIDAVIRDASYTGRLNHERANAEIARIRDEGRIVLARDETDFEITVERMEKHAELRRRAPLALTANTLPDPNTPLANTPAEPDAEQFASTPNPLANTTPSNPNTVREHVANKAFTSTNTVPEHEQPNTNTITPNTEPPSIADLVREQIALTPNNATAVRNVLAQRPDANKDSVAAAVRRERRKMEGGYA